MSNLRQFHLPQLLRKETSHDDAIPRFECNKLMVMDGIGQGAFGDVYTTDYRAPGKIITETVIIKNVKCCGRRREENFLQRSGSPR